MKIIIDPGHGGEKTGAIGHLDGKVYTEAKLNLEISLKLESALKLRNLPFSTYLTRRSNQPFELSQRVASAFRNDGVVFASVHCNSAKTNRARGFEVYHCTENYFPEKSAALATSVHGEVISSLGSRLIDRGVKMGDFYVIKKAHCPAILIECAFINNEHDLRLLLSENFQWSMAHALSDGIEKYLRAWVIADRPDKTKENVNV